MGTVEFGGPVTYPMEEALRLFLSATGDRREVVTTAEATNFGTPLEERLLVAAAGALQGTTRFEEWLDRATE